MISSAAALCGNGATMPFIRGRLLMEKKKYLYGGDFGEEVHDGISAWMGWYIRIEHLIPGFGIPECIPPGKSRIFLQENRGVVSGKLYELVLN